MALFTKSTFFQITFSLGALTLLLASSFLFLPSVSAFSAPLSAVSTQKGSTAGYEIFSATPGNFIEVWGKWNIPTVTCNSATANSYMQFYVTVGHISAGDAGSQLVVSCSGLTAEYSLTYINSNNGGNILPSEDKYFAGDRMETIASVATLGGETSISLYDFTQGWSFGVSGSETIDTTKPAIILWSVSGQGSPTRPLLQFSTISTSSDKATVDGHTGRIGSFIPLAGYTIFKWVFVDSSNGHVLARPSGITSTSNSFKINWLQGS